jgi:L-amino acid N-acyltransferase YncA
MLDIAIKHEEELKSLFLGIWHDEKYKFWNSRYWFEGYKGAAANTWDNHEFVSLDGSGKVIGYIAYEINRSTENVTSLSVLNFSENKIIFGKDLMKALIDIFSKYHFRKICFGVVIGNPIERSYDRLVKRYGGRVVGIEIDQARLMDGKYYNMKLYEIMNPSLYPVRK